MDLVKGYSILCFSTKWRWTSAWADLLKPMKRISEFRRYWNVVQKPPHPSHVHCIRTARLAAIRIPQDNQSQCAPQNQLLGPAAFIVFISRLPPVLQKLGQAVFFFSGVACACLNLHAPKTSHSKSDRQVEGVSSTEGRISP